MTILGSAVSRRRFLQGAGAACTAAAVAPFATSSVAFGASGAGTAATAADILVLVVLRGGLDGLGAVVPAGDSGYYQRRPQIRVRPEEVIPLDARFGLHTALGQLYPLYQSGDLAFVVATGSPSASRSHFDQLAALEGGIPDRLAVGSGWLGRHLDGTSGAGFIRGVTVGERLSGALLAGPRSTAIGQLDDFKVQPPEPSRTGVVSAALAQAGGSGPFGEAARDVLAAVDLIAERHPEDMTPANGAQYGNHPWSQQFRELAQLIRADVGVEAAVIDLWGWDTHVFQGGTAGSLADLMRPLAAGVAAFYTDLADRRGSLSIAVVSEFGRTVAENGSLGTDHGRGGVSMVLGGGIRGGQVFGEWLGLGENELDDGDVPVTTDFRDVLGELLIRRCGSSGLGSVFPDYTPTFLDLADPR